MARILQKMTVVGISRQMTPGYWADGGGLYLQVSQTKTKSWIFRYSMLGRRREMGLGPFPDVSLASARDAATVARTLVRSGHDPIAAREAEKARQRLEAARGVTFSDAQTSFLDSNESGWRNAKHRAQWQATLDRYAIPTLGKLPVSAIGVPEIVRVLEPIWHKKPETASRVRGRIERILDWAKVRGYRTAENPARWRGHLDQLFPSRRKVARVKHHAALSIESLPELYARLARARGTAALALRFVILTAARAGEVTGARWSEIDLDAKAWKVPPERIKAGKTHRVPLSAEALVVLAEAKKLGVANFVFPSVQYGKPLSLTALSKALKAAGGGTATTHGFRSTFRDWAAERTNFSREVAEMALAHAIGDKVEAAYRRGELFAKRTALMQRWATFAKTPSSTDNVVPLRGSKPSRRRKKADG